MHARNPDHIAASALAPVVLVVAPVHSTKTLRTLGTSHRDYPAVFSTQDVCFEFSQVVELALQSLFVIL